MTPGEMHPFAPRDDFAARARAAGCTDEEVAAMTDALGRCCERAIEMAEAHTVAMAPTDRWWAQRWLDKSTPGERQAMREALGVRAE